MGRVRTKQVDTGRKSENARRSGLVDAMEERLAMMGFLSFVRNWTFVEADFPMTPSQ